ncbi:MAG: ERAP1-like C-terminal domain-containing protein [Candidatus Saccharibacteria bacterium]
MLFGPIPLFSDLDLGKNDPFAHRTLNMTLGAPPANMLVNKGRRGFYRAIYDNKSVANVLSDNFMDKVSDVDRLGLLADAFEAAKGGYLPTLSALNMLNSYFDETSVVVWEVMAGALGSIRMAMNDDELRESMKPIYKTNGSKGAKEIRACS